MSVADKSMELVARFNESTVVLSEQEEEEFMLWTRERLSRMHGSGGGQSERWCFTINNPDWKDLYALHTMVQTEEHYEGTLVCFRV